MFCRITGCITLRVIWFVFCMQHWTEHMRTNYKLSINVTIMFTECDKRCESGCKEKKQTKCDTQCKPDYRISAVENVILLCGLLYWITLWFLLFEHLYPHMYVLPFGSWTKLQHLESSSNRFIITFFSYFQVFSQLMPQAVWILLVYNTRACFSCDFCMCKNLKIGIFVLDGSCMF